LFAPCDVNKPCADGEKFSSGDAMRECRLELPRWNDGSPCVSKCVPGICEAMDVTAQDDVRVRTLHQHRRRLASNRISVDS